MINTCQILGRLISLTRQIFGYNFGWQRGVLRGCDRFLSASSDNLRKFINDINVGIVGIVYS